ncbi:SCO2524 family protein [Streptomyces varsoviensis]|uniref:SCO2524 family protein n=1 Tax=Streptomyces varsoviensis TaxID=67373 RepID=UPI0033F75091
MRIQPRQHLLEIWQAVARHSFPDGGWQWGERGGASSVADAEHLLCLLYPATEIPAFRLDAPNETTDDALRALRRAGTREDIPCSLIAAVTQFMAAHTTEESVPSFAGGYYFAPQDPAEELTPEQRALGVVDSYSMSITLALATLGFLKVYAREPRRKDVEEMALALEAATRKRLTAAMVSLLRCFTVNLFDAESEQGVSLCDRVNQEGLSRRSVVQQLRRELKPIRAAIREYMELGINVVGDLGNENLLFECGWSWGVVQDAPPIDTTAAIGAQPKGVARPEPYLYFTVVALDGIADLFSDRTLTLGLLNTEQQRLAEALRLRWEITQQYWSKIARFGEGRWPLEDVPWRTGGQYMESDYFSLSVAAILVQDLFRHRATDDDLTRTVAVMEELASRAKITRRMTRDDPAVELHNPGIRLPLLGSESLGPAMQWSMSDFPAQLLKRTIQLCSLSRNIGSHDRLLRLAEQILDHLWERRIPTGPGAKLWDNVHAVCPDSPPTASPLSWTITERIVECMTAATGLYRQPPIRSAELNSMATALLSEAGHLFGNEMMEPTSLEDTSREIRLKTVELQLRRARQLVDDRPGTACALALDVLGQLDELVVARRAGSRGV